MGSAFFTAVAVIVVLFILKKSDTIKEKSEVVERIREQRRLYLEEQKRAERQKVTEHIISEQKKYLENSSSKKLAMTVQKTMNEEK